MRSVAAVATAIADRSASDSTSRPRRSTSIRSRRLAAIRSRPAGVATIVAALLAAGASTTVANADGRTTVDLATDAGFADLLTR